MMLTESFVSAIRAQPRSANTAIARDVGIYTHDLHPSHAIKSSLKKSSSGPNSVAVSSTHIFAAQAGKAALHVYSRERGNQEALVPFGGSQDQIHSLTLVNDSIVALGTAGGEIIIWELCTGRSITTPPAHLQPVSCLAATSQHLISGAEDANLHVWSLPELLSLSTSTPHEPLRRLSNHRAAITGVAMGHSATNKNFCVSASRDKTSIVWDYHTGHLLRTFLLPSTPLSLTLDPSDRAVYYGFQDGSIQVVDVFQPKSVVNSLYDKDLQSTPLQVTPAPFAGAPADIGSPICLAITYDGSSLLSGHDSGKILQWETGSQKFMAELTDLNAPVTNLVMLSPFPTTYPTKAVNITKPKFGEVKSTFTAQFVGDLNRTELDTILQTPGFPDEVLEAAIAEFATPAVAMAGSSAEEERLRKENAELWEIVNEQKELQKQTWNKYRKLQSGKVET